MKRLLVYIIAISIMGFLGAWLFFSFAYNPHNRNDMSNFEFLLSNKDSFDIIALGSSRTQTMVNPIIIDSISGLNSFNFGLDAVGILELRMLLLKFLQIHPKPLLILLNIDYNGFYSKGFLYNTTDYYKYLNDSIINHALCPYNINYGNYFVRKANELSRMFGSTDNEKSNTLFKHANNKLNGFHNYPNNKGFLATETIWNEKSEKSLNLKLNALYDEQGFFLFKDFIGICKKNSIKLILVHAPILNSIRDHIINYDEILKRVKNISRETETPYWEYDTMKICSDKKYFTDLNHLNINGANIYSTQLAIDIKKFISEKNIFKN